MKGKNIYGLRKPISYKFMSIDQIKYFFHCLQLAIVQKKLYFTFTQNKDLETILTILQKAHYIAGFTKDTVENKFKIFLSYDLLGTCVIKEAKPVSSVRQRMIINTKQIKAFLHDYPYCLAIVRTRNGIKDIKECWNERVGGEVIAYIK